MQSSLEWIIITVLALVGAAWVALPLRRRNDEGTLPEEANGNRQAELLRKKEQAYAELKELEFDHKVGKLSDGDFEQLTRKQRAVAVAILQQLEAFEEPDDLDRYIDAEVARRLSERNALRAASDEPSRSGAPTETQAETQETASVPASVSPRHDSSSHDAGAAVESEPASGVRAAVCGSCGGALRAGARFCSHCGAAVSLNCAGCQQPLDAADRFCSRCGTAAS